MLKSLKNRVFFFRALTVFFLGTGIFGLRSCSQWHTRPDGITEIAFNISHKGDRIVFTAQGKGGRDLYLLDLRSKRVTCIAQTPAYEGTPSFSSDDKSVLYVAGFPGDRADHIFVRALDGSKVQQITNDDYNDFTPAFSFDDSLIVFARNHKYRWGGLASSWGGDAQIYLVKSAGTQPRRMTNAADVLNALNPKFTSDAKSIIFTAGSLFLMDIDKQQSLARLRVLLKGRGLSDEFSISPNGRHIVMSSMDGILLANMDGSGLTQIVGSKDLAAINPVFSDDGKHLFFLSHHGEPIKINATTRTPVGLGLWQMDIDGKNLRRIADHLIFDNPLGWKS